MDHIYSVATGSFDIKNKASRAAVKLMKNQDGYVGTIVEPTRSARLLWMYDSLNNAKIARNTAEGYGIKCGSNIVEFNMEDGNWVPGEVVG